MDRFQGVLTPKWTEKGKGVCGGSEHARNYESLKKHSFCVLQNKIKVLRSTFYNPYYLHLRQSLQNTRSVPITQPPTIKLEILDYLVKDKE